MLILDPLAFGPIGEITQVNLNYYKIKYSCEGFVGDGNAKFPNYNNPFYLTEQWNKPGYFKLQEIKKVCDCRRFKSQDNPFPLVFNKTIKENKK
jgi:hypothetical protein